MSSRRLVAIMFTDIEGYTALMQHSEARALHFRETHRKIFRTTTEAFQGEIVQYYGDGTLSIFNSAVDAVQCGIALQRAFQEDPRIPVRIGIHSGDILISREDIIGDAVNLASRVESLAVAGSVLISEKVYDEIKNSSEIEATFLDAFHLKNVAHPVGIYAISNEGLVVPPRKAIAGKLEPSNKIRWPLISGLIITVLLAASIAGYQVFQQRQIARRNILDSVVVLPFENYTGRDDMDYLIEGMHSALIGDLGKISTLRVISPTTARAYKDAGKPVPEIAAELNVDAVLEVAVLSLGDSIRIQPKLLRAYPEEQQIWIADYYEAKSHILSLYSSIAEAVSEQFGLSLSSEEEQLLAITRTVDTTAYDLYMKGHFYLDQVTDNSLQKAFQYFRMATEIEPEWAPPYAGLASVVQYQMQMNIIDPSIAIPIIDEYVNQVLELDSNAAIGHYQKAVAAVWSEWDWEKGEEEFLRSIDKDPNHALSRMFYAHLLTIQRRTEEALVQAEIARDLDPLRPLILGLYGVVLIEAGEYEEAVVQLEKAISLEPDHVFARGILMDASELAGDYQTAFACWKYVAWWDEDVVDSVEQVFQEKGYHAAIEAIIQINEQVEQAGGTISYSGQASRYLQAGRYDQAVAYMEKAYMKHDPDLPYISTNLFYNQLRDHPGYIALMKKMKLPL